MKNELEIAMKVIEIRKELESDTLDKTRAEELQVELNNLLCERAE